MSLEYFHSLISELGRTAGLLLQPDESGFCSLDVDGSVVANIQYVKSTNSAYFFYELGALDGNNIGEIAQRLLAANLFGVETGGGTLAMHKDSLEVVFSYSLALADVDMPRFEQVFSNTLRYAEYWKQEIGRAREQKDVDIQGTALSAAFPMMRV